MSKPLDDVPTTPMSTARGLSEKVEKGKSIPSLYSSSLSVTMISKNTEEEKKKKTVTKHSKSAKKSESLASSIRQVLKNHNLKTIKCCCDCVAYSSSRDFQVAQQPCHNLLVTKTAV